MELRDRGVGQSNRRHLHVQHLRGGIWVQQARAHVCSGQRWLARGAGASVHGVHRRRQPRWRERVRVREQQDVLLEEHGLRVSRPPPIHVQLEGVEQVVPIYIVNAKTTFYAHWTARDVAKYNNVVYPTITEAINKTPNNTKATITLLEDTDETVSIWKNKNIVIDLNGNKLTNYGIKKAVIKNEGILEIINGNVECLTVNGSIDNEATGTMKISGVTITNSAGRQALYNNGRVC